MTALCNSWGKKAILAFGPFLILGGLLIGLFLFSPFRDIEHLADVDLMTMLWMLTGVGAIAGIIPVMIGMLWYPFLRTITNKWIFAVMAFSAGVLVFAGVEMVQGIVNNIGDQPEIGGFIAILGGGLAFGILLLAGQWQYTHINKRSDSEGLNVAYIIAFGLGLHSIGEGLAIGTAFIQEEARLMTLLVIAFILDNVTEGPTIVAAVARDVTHPPIHHFLLMGIIAGGPVILGGWVGSFAEAPLMAVFFFAIGLGAIIEVVWEIIKFVGYSKGKSPRSAITKLNLFTFLLGFVFMVLIDEILIDMFLF